MHSTAARRWAALIDQAEQSDLTNRQFAEQVGVNPRTLAWWKWRLGASRRSTIVSPFVELVQETAEPDPIWLDLNGRLSIEVDEHTDLGLLRLVVDALC